MKMSHLTSPTTEPKIPARMGPMMGDTSMEATSTTVLFSMRPMKAIMDASTRSIRKSKVNWGTVSEFSNFYSTLGKSFLSRMDE